MVCQDDNRLQCYQPSANHQLVITPLEQASLTLALMTLMTATLNDFYSQTLIATGGVAPYQYVLVAGSLPAGLTLSASGVISGTPTTLASESFTIMITDATSQTTTQSYTVTVDSGKSCLLVVTGSLNTTTNPYNEAITLNYTMVGGGGGFGSGGGGGGGDNGIGGQGGSTSVSNQDGMSGKSPNTGSFPSGPGGLGALNWANNPSSTLPLAAGAGGSTTAAGGNSGLVIIKYQSPTDSCLLGQ